MSNTSENFSNCNVVGPTSYNVQLNNTNNTNITCYTANVYNFNTSLPDPARFIIIMNNQTSGMDVQVGLSIQARLLSSNL